MAGYSQQTLGTLATELGARLHDDTFVFWRNDGAYPELTSYIVEALRVFGALSKFWRNTVVTQTTMEQSFYDLNTLGVLVPTYRVRDAIADMQMRLMETVSPTVWDGTEQFTLADFQTALQRRRDQFLLETGMVLTARAPMDVGASPQSSRVFLPNTIISIRRASWADSYTGQFSTLWRDTSRASWGFSPSATSTPGVPFTFACDVVRPTSVILNPVPLNSGQLRLVTVETGAVVDPGTNPLLGVPDDWAWVSVYGACADLCGIAGFSLDNTRRDYFEQRYQQGVDLARANSRILRASINGTPVGLSSLSELDGFAPGWENRIAAPASLVTAGQNLVAVDCAPDVANQTLYGLSFDVVAPAPIPADTVTAVQIPEEAVDLILDYAQHVAAIKQGGGALATAQGLWDRFQRALGVEQRKAQAEDRDLDQQTGVAGRDEAETPRVRVQA